MTTINRPSINFLLAHKLEILTATGLDLSKVKTHKDLWQAILNHLRADATRWENFKKNAAQWQAELMDEDGSLCYEIVLNGYKGLNQFSDKDWFIYFEQNVDENDHEGFIALLKGE